MPYISTPPPRNDGTVISSNQHSYVNSLKLAESGAQLAKFDNVENIYVELLNDSNLGHEAQRAINAHIVATYQRHGDVHYEQQLTALFQRLRDEVRDTHKKINIELAARYKDNPSTGEFGSSGKYRMHLHIASDLGDLVSSQILANMYVDGSDVQADAERAMTYALQAQAHGDNAILFSLSKLYKEKGMDEAAQEFHKVAQLFYDPEIKPEKIDFYAGEELKFKLVDELISMKYLEKAEDALEKIAAAEHMDAEQQRKLFSEKPIISNVVKDWYCDHGPIYTRIALKLAKIYYIKGPQLHDKKIQELIGIIDATGSSPANNDIKCELGQWYLTRSLFVDSKEKESAIKLLEEIDVRKIPDTYPEMKKLFHSQIKKFL